MTKAATRSRLEIKNSFWFNEILVILCVEELFLMMGLGFFSPILPKFVQFLGVGPTEIGLAVGMAMTAYGFARAAIDIPAGRLVKYFGHRVVLVGAPAVVTISAFLCAFTTELWQLLIWRIMQGAGSAAFSVAALIVIGRISDISNRGMFVGIYWGTFLVGASLGPTLGGFLGEYINYRAPFFCYALLSFIATIWSYLRIPERITNTSSSQPAPVGHSSAPSQPSVTMSSLLKNRSFVLVSLITLCNLITLGGAQNTLIPILGYERLSLTESQIGLTLTLVAIMQLILTPFAGRFSDLVGRKLLIVCGGIITTLALGLFALSNSYLSFLLYGVILGIGRGISGPVPTTYASDLAVRGDSETVMSTYRTFSDLGWIIGPVTSGWIKDVAGINLPILGSAGLLFLFIVLFGFFAEETKKRPFAGSS